MKKIIKKKRIFVSHSEKNRDFVQILLDYLVGIGAERKDIFCSSDYRSGVNDKISDDVFLALRNTELDIIILSNEYKKSEFCLSEAGVIRSKEQKSIKIVIALPNIQNGEHAGFISTDYFQYRLETIFFVQSLANRLQHELNHMRMLNTNQDQMLLAYDRFQKAISRYRSRLPIIENLSINWASDNEQEKARLSIQQTYIKINKWSTFRQENSKAERNVFFNEYNRDIIIDIGKSPKNLQVRTTTSYTIVNLSDNDIFQEFSSQFLKSGKSIDSFSNNKIIINRNGNSELIQKDVKSKSYEDEGSPYILSEVAKIRTKAHSSDQVCYESIYEISPSLFFQSKVVGYPCGQFCIRANFTENFLKSRKYGGYIFRYQVIPPNPNDLQNLLIPSNLRGESMDKKSVFASYSNGFPAGGGYVLTLSTISSKGRNRF